MNQNLVETDSASSLAEYIFKIPAYKRFISVTQIVDTAVLDIETLMYTPQAIVLSALFCTIALSLKILTPSELFNYQIDNLTHNRVNMSNEDSKEVELEQLENPEVSDKIRHLEHLVWIYAKFLSDTFGIVYEELTPTIQYISLFAGGLRLAARRTSDEENQRAFQPGNIHALTLEPEVNHSQLDAFYN